MPEQQLINQIIDRVNDFNRRMRDLEEKIRNINARVNTLDDTILNKTKHLNQDLEELDDEITSLRDRIANIEVDIKELNKEKRRMATKKEFEELEKYMDLMNPIKSNFMTEKQVKEIVDDRQGVSKQEVEKMIDSRLKNSQD